MNPFGRLFNRQPNEQQLYQQQVGEQPVGMDIEASASVGMTQPGDVTRFILETADILEEIEHKLKGDVWMNKDQKWVRRGKPFLNDEGVNRIVTVVSGFFHRGISLSYFTEDDIKRICYEVRMNIINLLEWEWEAYQVEKSMLDIIVTIVDGTVFSMLRRGFKGRELDSLGQRYKHVESPQYLGKGQSIRI